MKNAIRIKLKASLSTDQIKTVESSFSPQEWAEVNYAFRAVTNPWLAFGQARWERRSEQPERREISLRDLGNGVEATIVSHALYYRTIHTV
ncbi:MAG: hypothetical protein EOP06_26000 [Proteobacteria bacterium]|nr:MAG: hypothetical protein EOP06_26000 [Pseudomonadota bacterium]